MAATASLPTTVTKSRLLPPSSSVANPIFSSSSSKPNSSHSFSNVSSFRSVSMSRRSLIDLGVGLLAFSAPIPEANATRIEYYATVGEPPCDLNFVKSGLGFCDVAVGNGVGAPGGELINVHYTARFADGTVFDSSYKRGRPLTMRIGVGKVLPGLDQGILGGGGVPPMQVCGKRKLFIPAKLAYGPEPAGCFSGDCNIPANATLLYDVLFVGIYK
uniref:peptidylprolyl isomerase n=1 Tax=Masdevallia picturata TaxID=125444 RepID=A0A0F7H0T6_9ASPA